MSDTELLRDAIQALDRKLDSQDRKLSGRLDSQDRTLGRIEGQVRETNGRVTAIEKDRAAEKAVRLNDQERNVRDQERRVRAEDYQRGPQLQNRIAMSALVLAVLLPVVLKFL